MNKTWFAAALFGAVSSLSYAQSNVTIYGIADLGIRYTNDIGGLSKMETSSGTPNRLGFRGTEDLGGGLSALFVLENGFNMKNGTLGQGGRIFGRQTIIGLQSKELGKVTLGRQYDSVVDYLQPLSAGSRTWAGGLGSHFGDIDNVNNTFRFNNAIKYTSADLNGFVFGGAYSLGEVAGNNSTNSAYSVGARYNAGPWMLAAAYMNVNNPISAVYDGNPATNSINGAFGYGANPYVGLQYADKIKVVGAGASYALSNAKYGVLYTSTQLPNSFLAKGDAKYQNLEVNGQYEVSPTIQIGGAYTYTVGRWESNNTEPKYHQVNLGIVYHFSKVTDFYIQTAYQRVGGDATIAELNLLAAPSGGSQRTAQFAFRKIF